MEDMKILTFITTDECTISCGHCIMSCGPSKGRRLSLEQMKKVIKSAAAGNALSVVVFTGGEPMLLGEDLLDAIAYVDSLGLTSRIVTNASWAVSPDAASATVRSLREAGLVELNISADDYHLPFVPIEHIRFAYEASRGQGFGAVVIANSALPGDLVTPAFLKDRLGGVFDERCSLDKNLFGPPAADGTRYVIYTGNVQRLGRAKEMIGPGGARCPGQCSPFGSCPNIIQTIAISPGNRMQACCGFETETNAFLDFGSLDLDDFQELLAEGRKAIVPTALALAGPDYLKEFVQIRSPKLTFESSYSSMCELCEAVVTREDVGEVIRAHEIELAASLVGPLRARLSGEAKGGEGRS